MNRENIKRFFLAFLTVLFLGIVFLYVLDGPPVAYDQSGESAPVRRSMEMRKARISGMVSQDAPMMDSAVASAPPAEFAMAREGIIEGSIGEKPASRTIAYTHFWSVEVKDRSVMKARLEQAAQFCLSGQFGCELLGSSMNNDREYPSASLSARLNPDGVPAFKNLITQNGTVLNENTSSEQMAEQITDVERRLATRESYLQRLDELAKSPGNLEDTLRLQQEISNVVAEIENLKSQARQQQKRVEKEIINVSLSVPPPAAAATAPLDRAFKEFGRIVGQSTAKLITAFARLLPWIPVLLIVIYIVRGLMTQNWGFRKSRQHARSSQ